MEENIYLNGAIVSRSRALISVFDHAFLYGYGLYESMRAYHGQIFLLDRHISRMRKSAEIIGLADKLAAVDLARACRETLVANKLEEARIRVTVSNGDSDAAPWVDNRGRATIVVTARPYTPFSTEKYDEGFHVGIANEKRCRQSVVNTLKSVNHLSSALARMEVAASGLDEALLLNDDGYIAEGGGSNVFFMESSKLVTPPLDSGILPGVTREIIIELAEGMGITVKEVDIEPGALNRFDEAFVTNAMIEVMPVTAVKDVGGRLMTIGMGRPGPVTQRLMKAYRKRVEKETR